MDRTVLPWVTKGGFTLIDQALITGSNFVINILLARWLVPEHYGAYAVAFSIFVLLTVVYQSLLLEPMAVFGGSTYRGNLREYLRVLLRMQPVVSAAMCGPIAAWAVVTWRMDPSSALPGALAGVALAGPVVLVFWLARRTYYLQLAPSRSALGSSWYCVFALGGIFLVHHRSALSPFKAFLAMAVAAAVTAAFLLLHLRTNLQPRTMALGLGEVCRRHWTYGKWALVANIVSWVPAYLFYLLLARFSGMAHSGELRALMNFVGPQQQVQSALAMLFLPYAAGLRARTPSRLMALNHKLTFISVSVAIAYWITILGFKGTVLHLLYSGRYMNVAYLLPFVAVGSILWAGAFGPTVALRAMESPRPIFLAYCVATMLSLVIGIPATKAFGVFGAILAINVSDGVSWLMMILLLRHENTRLQAASSLTTNQGKPAVSVPAPDF